MRKRILAVAVAATAFLAVAVLWRSEYANPFPATPGVAPAKARASALAVTTTPNSPPRDALVPAAARFNFDAVTRISQLQDNRRQASVPPGQALEYLRTAAEYCEFHALDARLKTQRELKGQLSPPEKQTVAYQRAFGAQFCDTPVENSGALADRFLTLDADDDMLRAHMLPSLEGVDAQTVGVPLANSLILESASPDAIARAARFLLLRNESLPLAGSVPVPASIRGEQARIQAQLLAISMLSCDIRGGCGAQGFYTALNCGQQCGPGVSLQDVWKQSNSPEAIAYARALVAAIQARRTAASR